MQPVLRNFPDSPRRKNVLPLLNSYISSFFFCSFIRTFRAICLILSSLSGLSKLFWFIVQSPTVPSVIYNRCSLNIIGWVNEWVNLRINAKCILFPCFLFLFIALIIWDTIYPLQASSEQWVSKENIWHFQQKPEREFPPDVLSSESLIFCKSCSLYDKQSWETKMLF